MTICNTNSTTTTCSWTCDFYYAHAQEKYFDSHLLVYSSPEGEAQLPEGEHSYPFKFRLPEQLPSSFEGGIGWVSCQVVYTYAVPIVLFLNL